MCAVITACAALSLCSAMFDPIPSPPLDGAGDLHETFSVGPLVSGLSSLPACGRAIVDSTDAIACNRTPADRAHKTPSHRAPDRARTAETDQTPREQGALAASSCSTVDARADGTGSRAHGTEPCVLSGELDLRALALFPVAPGTEILEMRRDDLSRDRPSSSVSPPADGAAAPSRRPGALVPLYLALAALQGADAATTVLAVRAGGREMNPVVEPIADNWGAMLAVKSFSAGITIFAAERLWKKNPAAAIATMAGVNALYGYLVARNAQHLRQTGRRAPSR
jgi:hypothetical protein